MDEKLDDNLNLRMSKSDKENFIQKCKGAGRRWTDVLRELIAAFNSDSLTINKKEGE